ncbi:MAG: alpha-L-arabinofuranosidase C-terminal domain-containing protein [Lachnospiraceae bacterium]|nr:alpha-L-arabinofuranosidase C-terminal domain-containing protein [Lachnospiraceae bacterium]
MTNIIIDERKTEGHINPEIYGHFSEHLGHCIYGGIYVGENSEIPNVNGMRTDVVEALKQIQVPVLRWPGGCFADEYHWMDGIGPKENRKRMINTNWGGEVEDNSFGTHEYFELCRQLGCKTYINGNLGSGTVREMSEWVEYMTFDGESSMSLLRRKNGQEEPWRVNYFGVGNENWGGGGCMTPEYYANLYRHYQTYVRVYDEKKPICRVACGPNSDDYAWTRKVLETAFYMAPAHVHGYMDAIALHYYTVPGPDWQHKGSAVDFDLQAYYTTLQKAARMEEMVKRHSRIIEEFDPEGHIGLFVDEWGCWHDVEPGTNPGFLYQQNTMRDAMVAAMTLNIFNKQCRRVKMANIAQVVNVLQSVILTDGEKMVLTPTYHVFDLYKGHQGGELLSSSIENTKQTGTGACQVAQIYESASRSQDGSITVTVVNLSAEESEKVELQFADFQPGTVNGQLLTGKMDDYNRFDQEPQVKVKALDGVEVKGKNVSFTMPPCSVVSLTL